MNYEAAIIGAILKEIGERPPKPQRPGVNPFLLYTKDKWEDVKAHCVKSNGHAGRDAIRQTVGKWWRAASEEEKKPYLTASQTAQQEADGLRKEWEAKTQDWDDEARRIRQEYVRAHPPPAHTPDVASQGGGVVGVSKRKTNVSNNVVLDHA